MTVRPFKVSGKYVYRVRSKGPMEWNLIAIPGRAPQLTEAERERAEESYRAALEEAKTRPVAPIWKSVAESYKRNVQR